MFCAGLLRFGLDPQERAERGHQVSENTAVSDEIEDEEEAATPVQSGIKFRLIPLAEAQNMRKAKEPGIRATRMAEFATYAQHLIDNPEAAAVYEGDDIGQAFVLSLRGAFKRAGINAVVRKMRQRNEVRAWIPNAAPGTDPEAVSAEAVAAIAEAEAALSELAPVPAPQRRQKVRS